jgi:hypothetical protein
MTLTPAHASQATFLCLAFAILLLQSCLRTMIPLPVPPPSGLGQKPPAQPTQTDTFRYIKGTWGCTIDGVPYSGAIDSSFTHYDSSHDANHRDTVIFCTGSSAGKQATIHFQIDFNRYSIRNVPYFSTNTSTAQFDFDTWSDTVLTAAYGIGEVDFYIDSVNDTTMSAHFSGTTSAFGPNSYYWPGHIITNGIFTAGWQGGDHEPNSFAYNCSLARLDAYDSAVNGYFNSAVMVSNSLILDGMPVDWSGQSRFELLIRTGGTIQPGTYTSANGDAALFLYVPSVDRSFVADSTGSLTVTIARLSGNIVYGAFSGTNSDGTPITGGSFAVRVKNYTPEADSTNKWAFGMFLNRYPENAYHAYGGNVLNAALSTASGRNYLTVNGESDNGASVFKLVISSTDPITTGMYSTPSFSNPFTKTVDSLYFSSPLQATYAWTTSFNAEAAYAQYPTLVVIDSIDAHHVAGRIQGNFGVLIGSPEIQLGRFSASF